ncbi:hypothetical protein NQT62_08025 [Limnobacter humi]|uniref:Uncharacterized protein n=1 Tax=Limnobacter humi TaxID=1778671 RepID=A0ABT1WIY7_9BURK|nr:hypothetical protein [Limnobacter humi]MCQ8896379.1 hypothetical protein [Limnobacter humi]
MFSSPFSPSTPTNQVAGHQSQQPGTPVEGPTIRRAASLLSSQLLRLDREDSPGLLNRLGSVETAHQINQLMEQGCDIDGACLQDKLDWADAQRQALQRGLPIAKTWVLTPPASR